MNSEVGSQQAGQTIPQSEKSKGQEKLVIVLSATIIVFVFILSYVVYSLLQKPRQSVVTQTPILKPTIIPSPSPSAEQKAEEDVKKLETVSSSDEVDALDKDINASDFSNLDSELNSIEAQF